MFLVTVLLKSGVAAGHYVLCQWLPVSIRGGAVHGSGLKACSSRESGWEGTHPVWVLALLTAVCRRPTSTHVLVQESSAPVADCHCTDGPCAV